MDPTLHIFSDPKVEYGYVLHYLWDYFVHIGNIVDQAKEQDRNDLVYDCLCTSCLYDPDYKYQTTWAVLFQFGARCDLQGAIFSMDHSRSEHDALVYGLGGPDCIYPDDAAVEEDV